MLISVRIRAAAAEGRETQVKSASGTMDALLEAAGSSLMYNVK